mmetsp:Transcript_9962/g.16896  ORF Transcript_9962/g.16896 Transcript_9962/m.16896 type:complete len:96 (-) Transcript_9962:406-693(-)
MPDEVDSHADIPAEQPVAVVAAGIAAAVVDTAAAAAAAEEVIDLKQSVITLTIAVAVERGYIAIDPSDEHYPTYRVNAHLCDAAIAAALAAVRYH